MKNKTLKLFLVLVVIILSLFAFVSCEESEEKQLAPVNENLVEIKDKDLIDFLLNKYELFPGSDTSRETSAPTSLSRLYISVDKNNSIKEYVLSNDLKSIVAYAPKETIELIFSKDATTYLSSDCNTYSFYYVKQYMEENKVSLEKLGLKFYYVDKKSITAASGNDALIYLAEEITAKCQGKDLKVYAVQDFELESGYLKTKSDNLEYYGSKYIRVGAFVEDKLTIEDFAHYNAVKITTENRSEIIKEHSAYLLEMANEKSRAYLDLLTPALIYSETEEASDNEFIVIERIYDYLKIKEILEIK